MEAGAVEGSKPVDAGARIERKEQTRSDEAEAKNVAQSERSAERQEEASAARASAEGKESLGVA